MGETNTPNWKELLERLVKDVNRFYPDGFDEDQDLEKTCICDCTAMGEHGGRDTYNRWARGEHAPDCPWRQAKEAIEGANLVAPR